MEVLEDGVVKNNIGKVQSVPDYMEFPCTFLAPCYSYPFSSKFVQWFSS
jgi:hypothetical protein